MMEKIYNLKNLFLALFLFAFYSIINAQTFYRFDGVNDYATVPKNGNTIINDFSAPHDFTIEGRFRLYTALNTWGTVASMHSEPADGFYLGIDGNGTDFLAGMGRNWSYVNITSSTPAAVNTWYTIALVYDHAAHTFSLYVDGTLIGSETLASPHFYPETDYAMSFGKSLRWGGETPMDLDFVRIWTNKQTQSQLAANKDIEVDCNSTDLLVQYKFDSSSSSTAMTDCTSNGNHGAIFGAVLPVELITFNARLQNNSTNLFWQTASETNNEGFEIERSADGINWKNIGFIYGNGTTQEAQNYQFTDERPLKGLNYYRLKQMDYDGGFEYSDIKSLVFGDQLSGAVQLFPNPVNDGLLTIAMENEPSEGINILIHDLAGKTWLQQTSYDSKTQVDAGDLVSGIYIVEIIAGGQTARQRIVVE